MYAHTAIAYFNRRTGMYLANTADTFENASMYYRSGARLANVTADSARLRMTNGVLSHIELRLVTLFYGPDRTVFVKFADQPAIKF